MIQHPLASVSLFADLQIGELEALAARATTRTFPKNVILINEGDRSDSLYLILSGAVKVFVSNEDGKEMVLSILESGEYFGELALIDEEPRSASVITLEPCKAMIISRGDFIDCLRNHVELALELLKVLTRRLRQQIGSSKSLSLMNVYERVVKVLLELAREQDGCWIIDGLSHKDLADRVYASREAITQIFKELKLGGYIEADRKRIVIKKRLPAKW